MTSEKSSKNILIYGANGYTGKLIVEYALSQNLRPIVAGRNKAQIKSMAEELDLAARVFDLSSIGLIANNLKDVDVLIHCAGPFSQTAEIMMQACIESSTHYTDITGEISVFELSRKFDEQAKAAGIVICPGVGFDVIPTDCLASQLKEKLPDATHLKLGFDSGSGLSPGTAKTSVEGLGQGGKIRENGKIISVPLAFKTQNIDFGRGEKHAMTIPWGDVSTAYYSTGIPNIEVYIPISPKAAKKIKKLNGFRWLLKMGLVQKFLKYKAGQTRGPDASQREKLSTFVWGEARNDKGGWVVGRIETPNGYTLTAYGAIAVAKHLLESSNKVNGTQTPSLLCGSQLIHTLPETKPVQFEP